MGGHAGISPDLRIKLLHQTSAIDQQGQSNILYCAIGVHRAANRPFHFPSWKGVASMLPLVAKTTTANSKVVDTLYRKTI